MKTHLLLFLLVATSPAYARHNKPANNKPVSVAIKAPAADGSFTAKINGKVYSGKNNFAMLSLNYGNMGIKVFTIQSFKSLNAIAAAQEEHFMFSLPFSDKAPQKATYAFQDVNLRKMFSTNTGKYDAGQNAATAGGSPTDSMYSFAPARGGSGSVIITAINDNAVSGTFSGVAVNAKNKKMVISGSFTNLVIK